MGRFIVMDIVFHGNSLNYDQGGSNYQELKKITKWDGKQYTLVSRYALRYSMLQTGKDFGYWRLAEGNDLREDKEQNQKVIQPSENLLYSGEILNLPEFDLFGYLITSTDPQNFREAPVKISHAISMTPFSYDALFNANIGLANRVRKMYGEMKPNPFTSEEHSTFYQYSVVIDVDRIGKIEIYLMNEDKKFNIKNKEEIEVLKSELKNLKIINLSFKNEEKVKERIENLIRVILNLKRSIKGRLEDLSPKLIVLGVYENKPYKTYKDKISLIDEYTEEEYDEVEDTDNEGKRVVRVKHVVKRTKKPVFEVSALSSSDSGVIDEDEIIKMVDGLFEDKERGDIGLEKVKLFYSPEIEVVVK